METKTKQKFEIKVYVTASDFENRNGELIEYAVPTKRKAMRIAEHEFKTGFYYAVKCQSDDREFIEILKKAEL